MHEHCCEEMNNYLYSNLRKCTSRRMQTMSSVSDKSATYMQLQFIGKSREQKKTYEILRFRSYVLKKIISSFGRYNGRQTDGQYDRQDKKHYASDIQKVCVWGGGGIKLNHIHRLADVLKINQIPVQLQSSFQLKLPNQIYF